MSLIRGILFSANRKTKVKGTKTTSVPTASTPVSASIYKLSLLSSSSSNVVFESNILSDMMTYLAGYSFNVPTTLQFNTSDTYTVNDSLAFNFSNSTNLFTVKAKTGQNPVLDGNNAIPTLMTVSMSNIILDGIQFNNADASNSSGAIVRINSNTKNITFKNSKFKKGYCAMRATGTIDGSGNVSTYIDGLTITDCSVEDTVNGSFRFGNGDTYNLPASTNFAVRNTGYYDMRNVNIQNITLIDNFNKAVVTGQTNGFMGMLILKRILGLTVKNIKCNNTSDSLVQVENSGTVILDRITCNNFGFNAKTNIQGMYVTDSDDVTITNNFLKPNSDGVSKTITGCNNVRNLKAYYNTFAYINSNDVPFYISKMALVRLVGNLFKSGAGSKPCEINFTSDNGYNPSIAQDLVEEDYNVFCSDSGYNTNLQAYSSTYGLFSVEVQTNATGSKINPTTYKSTYGLGTNSIFTTDTNLLFSNRINPDTTTSYPMYITNSLQGRNAITSIQKSVTLDAFGFTRTYPTDIGATDRDAVI